VGVFCHFKVVGGVEAVFVAGLDGGGVICGVEVGNEDVAEGISALGSCQFESAFWFGGNLRSFLQGAPTVS
jgi:hypothetical protein